MELVGKLPAAFDAAVAVAVHLNPVRESRLPAVLGRVARIPVVPVVHGAEFEAGRLHIAVPDYHALVDPTHDTVDASLLSAELAEMLGRLARGESVDDR